jgi:hypothetical protein
MPAKPADPSGGPTFRSRRPTLAAVLTANAPVLWTWLVTVALVYAVQLGAGLGTPSMGLALSSAALPAAVVAATPTGARRWVMVGVVAALALLALGNALYHGHFGDYIPLAVTRAAAQLWDVRGYAVEALSARQAPELVAIVVTAVGALALRRRPAALSRRWTTALPLGVALLGLTPALGWAWVVSPTGGDVKTGGFLYAHLVDARGRLDERALADEPSPEEMAQVLALVGPASAPVPEDGWFGRAAGSSVLLLQVEALNDWTIDADVGGEPVMPFVRSLADRGLRFTDVYDAVHLGQSSDADYLVMASQHPLARGAVSMMRPNLDMVALPDVLREQGWTTLSAHPHHPGFWNARTRHHAYGFETSLFEDDLGPGETFGLGLTDRAFLERIAPALERLERPYLGWLITMTMHGPHGDVPASFHTLPTSALDDTPLGNYLLKARHTDDAIRALLTELTAQGALDDATVVVYGDHTERFGFDDDAVRRLAAVPAGTADLQRLDLDRIALVVVPPERGGAATGDRVATPGTLLDVGPTVLHLLGILPPRAFLGRSLLPEGAGFAAQITGEVVGDGRMWTGAACYERGTRAPLPASACAALRVRARAQLEGSWLITRYGLSARLDRANRASTGAPITLELR